MTSALGVSHPQEGVFNGHFNPTTQEKDLAIKQLQDGVLLPVNDASLTPDPTGKYTVADMITGYGVSEAVNHYYSIYGGSIKGKRVIIQGWGNVGAAAAYYQSQLGAVVVGIIDRVGGLINTEGFTTEEIKTLFLKKNGNFLNAENMLSFREVNQRIWSVGAEIFIPAAASRLITKAQIDIMKGKGLEVISCGANVPFADQAIFFGPVGEYTDSQVSVIPDFIANCGMARVFAYLMQANSAMTDLAIFDDTSKTIEKAMRKAHKANNAKTQIAKTAFEIALNQLV
jgi:glutamate dehydrogenase/leucine dehydrogenase